MAEAGDRGARDAILRIIQRDPLPEKRSAQRNSWHGWTRADDKADDLSLVRRQMPRAASKAMV